MGKIWAWIKSDGLLHIETCALIAVVVSILFPWWVGGLVAVAAGLGKEIWDMKHDGVATWHDFFCDLIGAAIGMVVSLIQSAVMVC